MNYKTSSQLNYLNSFGSLALFLLMTQILSGLFLALRYINSMSYAFDSVQNMNRINMFGYIFQPIHSMGASLFLSIIFMHFLRSFWYSYYKSGYMFTWCSGVFILMLTMLAAFSGYILPWGQMSYWAATVIFNFFSIMPLMGPKMVTLLFGGEVVGQSTLSRIYVMHFMTPFMILLLVLLHMIILHKSGSTAKYFTPRLTVGLNKFMIKDMGVFCCFITFMYLLMIYMWPNLLTDFLNLEHANGMITPKHIKPEWYFMPFYGILKTMPHKVGGMLCMAASIIIFMFFPFISFIKLNYWVMLKNFMCLKIKLTSNMHTKTLLKQHILPLYSINMESSLLSKVLIISLMFIFMSLGFSDSLYLGKYYIVLYFSLMIWLI